MLVNWNWLLIFGSTEKVPGMFGTLVICLPSKHEGGELHLTHGKSTKIFKTAGSSELGVSFLAWSVMSL